METLHVLLKVKRWRAMGANVCGGPREMSLGGLADFARDIRDGKGVEKLTRDRVKWKIRAGIVRYDRPDRWCLFFNKLRESK